MQKPNSRKADSASDTSLYQSATSGTTSFATVISSTATGSQDSDLKLPSNENFQQISIQEDQKEGVPSLGPNISGNSHPGSTSSSTADLLISKKITHEIGTSPISSLSQSSSSDIEEYEKASVTAIEPPNTAAHLDSVETIEIILKEPSKRNVTASDQQRQSSNASIFTGDELNKERKQTETLGNASKVSHNSKDSSLSVDSSFPAEMKIHRDSDSSVGSIRALGKVAEGSPNSKDSSDSSVGSIRALGNAPEGSLNSKDSILSVTASFPADSSELKAHRDSDSSVGSKAVRFSLHDTAPQPQQLKVDEKHVPDRLKSSKSLHVAKHVYDSSEDEVSMLSTNLEIGHVFVYMVVPPDGGYGWFICFISFLCQVIIDGIVFTIGILLPHIATDFNKLGSEVILIASLQTGCYFLSGTVASAFINKYGFRPVAFTGAVLAITFLTIATFSINLPMMILFHSILGGPALSLVWVSSQLVIGYYFDRYRPIANGASCSGAGVGIMLFAFMNSVLVPKLGWRNLMRLHVGFLVVVLLMTLSFVEVAPTRIGRVTEPLAEDTDSDSLDVFYGLTDYSRVSIILNNEEYPLEHNFEALMEKHASPDEAPPTGCRAYLRKCCCRERQVEQKPKDEKRYVIQQELIEKQDFFYAGPKDAEMEAANAEDFLKSRAKLTTATHLEFSRWRILSLEEMDNANRRNTIMRSLSCKKLVTDQETKPYRLTYAQLKVTKKHPILEFISPRNWLHPKIQKAFRLLFDFRLLDMMEFRILLLSAFLFPMGFNIPFVYSTVRAEIDGSFAKLITPTIGFSNFAFRITSGFVAFKFREYTTYICGGGMFFGGMAVFVSAFYGINVVWFQFLYAISYGIAPAFFSTLRAIIYVRTLGLDKLTNAFGLTALAMGLGVFIGTTVGGILNDLTGSFAASFMFAGICICTAGALKMLLPYFIKISKDKAKGK